MMMGTGARARIRWHNSTPDWSGSITSSRTRSGCTRWKSRSASWPSAGQLHREALAGQPGGQRLAVGLLVVDHQHQRPVVAVAPGAVGWLRRPRCVTRRVRLRRHGRVVGRPGRSTRVPPVGSTGRRADAGAPAAARDPVATVRQRWHRRHRTGGDVNARRSERNGEVIARPSTGALAGTPRPAGRRVCHGERYGADERAPPRWPNRSREVHSAARRPTPVDRNG